MVWMHLALFTHSFAFCVDHLLHGSFCSGAAGIYSLAFLVMLVHLLALKRRCTDIQLPYYLMLPSIYPFAECLSYYRPKSFFFLFFLVN